MKFKSPIEVQAGISDGDPTNPLGQSGYLLSSDGSNVNWISPGGLSAETAEAIVQPIKASGALSKGDPVYIVGYQNGQNVNIVAKADSSDAAKMPVVGLADDDYSNNNFGTMTAFGSFNGNFDTSGGTENWAVGDIIFVKPGGGLTNIKPGGTDLIQNVAIVSRAQQNTGELEVIALGRTNDVPNLPTGRLFVGTAANTSLASDVIYVDDTNDRVGIGTANPGYNLDVQDSTNGMIRAYGSSIGRLSLQNNTRHYSISTQSSSLYFFDESGASTRMIINSSGNVGIGTTSPASILHVEGGSSTTNLIASSGNGFLRIADSATSATRKEFTILLDNTNNRVDMQAIQQGVAARNITLNASGGNVGIGTTGPTSKLQVNTGSDINAQFGLDSFGSFKLGDVANNYTGVGVFYDGTPGSEDLQASASTFRISGSAGEGIQTVAGGDVYLNSQSGVLATLDASTNNFGIGTTTPSGKLEVRQAANNGNTGAFTNTHVKLTASATADNTGFVGITAATSTSDLYGYSFGAQRTSGGVGDFKINYHNNSAAGVNRFIIDQDGNVGIGAPSPGQKLSVAPSTDVSGEFGYAHVGNVGFNGYGGFSHVGLNSQGNYAMMQSSAGMTFLNASSGQSIRFRINNSDKMTLDSSGRLGIGTSGPQTNLHVANGTLRTWTPSAGTTAIFESTQNSRSFITITGANESELWFGDGTTQAKGRVRYENNNNTMEFWTNAAPRMYINSSGNVGIGTTNPQSTLQVNGGVQLANDTASPSASKVGTFRYRTSGNNSYVDMCMQTGTSTYAWVNIVANTW